MKRLLAVLLVLFADTSALAAPPTKGAAELKHDADASFDAGRYAEAAEGYARAYELKPDPTLLYNQARALEAMGEYPDALERLERFGSTAPPDLRAKVPALESLTEDLRARITSITVHTNAPGARLLVRGRDFGEVTESTPVRVRAGNATLRVVAEGYRDEERTVDLRGGTIYDLRVTMARREGPKNVGGNPGLTSQWWFWTGLAVIVGAGAATAIALTTEKDPESGSFAPGRITAGLVTF